METKKWWQSKAVWGGLVAVGGAVAGAFGIQVDEQTKADIVDCIMVMAGAAGGMLAIYGRLKADKKIK
ncbi:MAG: hypothetical protein ACOY4I_04800 [Bacillota bacterium]